MNWLLFQFFIISLVPLAFVAIIVYLLSRQPAGRPLLTRWWVGMLVLFALWASRQLTPYLGVEAGQVVPYFWEAFANYPLVLAGAPLLLATSLYLSRPLATWRWLVWIGPLLAVLAFVIDPALWPGRQGGVAIGQVVIRLFDVWAAVWVASWVVPVLAGWILTEQVLRQSPASIYRNQVVYWLLILSLLFLGGTLALARDVLVVQQIGAILLLVGSFLGTLAITRSRLPNLPQTARLLGFHLLRGAVAFIFSTAVLIILTVVLLNTEDTTTTIITAGALFTLVLLGGLAITNRLLQLLILKKTTAAKSTFSLEKIHHGPLSLEKASGIMLDALVEELDANGGWLAIAEERETGGLIFRPVAGDELPIPIALPAGTPFITHFLDHQVPLIRDDIAHLPEFTGVDREENPSLSWPMAAYIPLTAHGRLVGLAAVQEKKAGDPYTDVDVEHMIAIGREIGPVLAQSQTIESLMMAADAAQAHNIELKQEWQRLTELVDFYHQFFGLHSPDQLRRPFTDLLVQLQQLESELGPQVNGSGGSLHRLQEQINQSRDLVDNLIDVASHLEKQSRFELGPVYLDEVIRTVLVMLEDMLAARKVRADLQIRGHILPVWGDRDRLEEAVLQLLHNAIKFNRIEGKIEISCQMQRDEVRLEIRDEGVGIREDRLDQLWRGLEQTPTLERLGRRRRSRIGLPLVNFIVKAHGGRIEVESSYGHGSTFRVFLPARIAD